MVKADAFGSFFIASTVGLFVVVYVQDTAHDHAKPEHRGRCYVGKFCWAFPVDIVLIGSYLALSLSIAHIAGRTSRAQVVVATSLTTALLTGLFAAFFRLQATRPEQYLLKVVPRRWVRIGTLWRDTRRLRVPLTRVYDGHPQRGRDGVQQNAVCLFCKSRARNTCNPVRPKASTGSHCDLAVRGECHPRGLTAADSAPNTRTTKGRCVCITDVAKEGQRAAIFARPPDNRTGATKIIANAGASASGPLAYASRQGCDAIEIDCEATNQIADSRTTKSGADEILIDCI